MQCDFCSSPDVVRSYQCRDFDSASKDAGTVLPGGMNLILASHGLWAACAECSALIDAGDIDGLVRRALDSNGYLNAHVRQGIGAHLKRTYELFFQNRLDVSAT